MILLVSFGSDQLSWYRFDLPFVHWFIPLLSVVFCSRLCSAFKINILHRYPFKAAFFHQIIGLSLYFFCGHHRILQGILTSDSVAWIPLKESFTFDFHMCSALVCTSFLKVIKSVHGIIPFVFGYLFASGMVELCFEPAIYSKRPFIRFLLFSFLLVIFRSTPDPCFIEVFSVLSLHIANGRSLYYLDWVFWSVSRFLTGCFFQQRCGGKSFSVLLPLESILPFVSLVHPCTWYDASFCLFWFCLRCL